MAALKDLLVCLDATDRSAVRLHLAVDLARRHGSWLTALYVREWSLAQLEHRRTAELAARPGAELAELDSAVEESIDRSERQQRSELEQLAARHALQVQWRTLATAPGNALPQHARYADLCILGVNGTAGSTSTGYRLSEQMPLIAGRPVLLVPDVGDFTVLGAHVAVAWNSSPASARALNDALPILERSQHTTVITLNAQATVAQHEALPMSSLLEHLRRHGVSAQWLEIAAVPAAAIAERLQEAALSAGADLLVAGAHGHTWVHELMLGSVTRELLAQLRLPALMSH